MGGGNCIEVTYQELVALRNNSKLKPGCWYRLTDYQCTTTQEDTQADNKIFDILILAITNNSLSEECRAIHNKIDKSLDYCNLNAWKIWYCLDNDTNKFAWADEINGKGVIYRMIDEYGNDCPYDFKNIMFKRFKVENTTFNLLKYIGISNNIDIIKAKFPDTISDTTDFKFYHTFALIDRNTYQSIEISTLSDFNEYPYENFCNNIIKPNYNGTKYSLPNNIYITPQIIHCYNNAVGNNCVGNTFISIVNDNTFGNECNHNIILESSYNTFGNVFKYNIILETCNHNIFGNECYNNFLNSYCSYNSFSNNCVNNNLDDNCQHNSFGNFCNEINLSSGSYNSFGNFCSVIRLGNNSYSNSFSNNCSGITFGQYCQYNSFGNFCNIITGGKNCYCNSFGNNCVCITFGYKDGEDIVAPFVLFDNYKNNIFDNGCGYIIFGNKSMGNTLKIQNWHIQLGVCGNAMAAEYLEIKPTTNAQDYLVRVFMDKYGVLNIVDSN